MWPDRHVACIWLPQLPIQVEVLRHPHWAGRPLVLAGERRTVGLCSPEAEQAGLRPGLPLREVPALCAEAVVLQPDPIRVAAVAQQVLTCLAQVSPLVELAGERLFLGLGGLGGLYGDLAALERAVRAVVPQLLRPRIGVAAGKFAAAVAAHVAPPLGLHVVPRTQTVAFLAQLPIDHLPFEPRELSRLELLGLRTIGELAALPFSAVQAQFGPVGARAWRLARGQDDEPVLPRHPAPVAQAVLRFDYPLGTVDAVMAALDQLLVRVFADPVMRARSTRRALLRAQLADQTAWELVLGFKEPLSTRDAVRRALEAKLSIKMPPAPIEELALELNGLGGETGRQLDLFGHTQRADQVTATAQQLQVRYGHMPLYHIRGVERWSRIPERRWRLLPVA
jgi:protein ImuB